MSTHTDELAQAFDTARRFMLGEHERLLRRRDAMHVEKSRHLKAGEIGLALEAERTAHLLNAELSGLGTGSTQIEMLRKRLP